MVIEKTKLYKLLWSQSDKLRGPIDVDRFKDYVLVLLFVKYASDRYADVPDAPITVPPGSGYRNLVALKGLPDLGRRINEEILAPFAAANGLSTLPDFNDSSLFGVGREMVDRLSDLIAVFESPQIDFSLSRPEDDEDPVADAYEFLMRYAGPVRGNSHCDKSPRDKLGREKHSQPYVPAEVGRLMAQILGVGAASDAATAYDPAYYFGSPLVALQVESRRKLKLYAQSETAATSTLARLHLRLHDRRLPEIAHGNPFADPRFKDGTELKKFDFVVANPPLGNDPWLDGCDPMRDPFKRFQPFGAPPERRSSYAYLLHIVQSLNADGRGACILPLRVMSRGSRGDAETEIRWALVRKGLISGIIGLPSDLFFGTGISMCLVLVDRRGAYSRKGIFMIDAGFGFVKDGLKNRLREQDVRKIVDVFDARVEVPNYSRMVSINEIAKSDYNLNVVHYIAGRQEVGYPSGVDSRRRGAAQVDLDAVRNSWTICPQLDVSSFDADANTNP